MSLVPAIGSGSHERDSPNPGLSVGGGPQREDFGLFLLSKKIGID